MGKGAGQCGARSAMSLQSAGEAVVVESPQMRSARTRRQERFHEHSRIALEQNRYLNALASRLFGKQTPSTLKKTEGFVDQLTALGWTTKSEAITRTFSKAGASPLQRQVRYEITAEGRLEVECRKQALRHQLADYESRRQQKHAEQAIKTLQTLSPVAQQVMDFIAKEQPRHPNQARLRRELAVSVSEMSSAINALLKHSILKREPTRYSAGKGLIPAHYMITSPVFKQALLAGEKESPSMAALMSD